MKYSQISIVIFFSVTLIFSIFSNLPHYAYGSILLYENDETIFNTEQYVRALIPNLPAILKCDEFPFIGDLFTPFSDIYVDSTEKARNLPTNDFPALKPYYPSVVGGSNRDEYEFIAKPNILKAGPKTYAVGFDHCQDGKINENEGDGFNFGNPFIIEALNPTFQKLENYKKLKDLIKEDAKRKESEALTLFIKASIDVASVSIVLYAIAKAQAAAFSAKYGIAAGFAANAIERFATVAIEAVWGAFGAAYIKGAYNEYKKYHNIAVDPPDLDYKTQITIHPSQKINFTGSTNLEVPSSFYFHQLGNNYRDEGDLVDALLHAMEKYDGSLLANDIGWNLILANEIKKFSLLLKNQLETSTKTSQLLLEKLEKGDAFLNVEDKTKLKDAIQDISTNGFNSTVIRDLKNNGFTDKQIADIKTSINSVNLNSDKTFIDILKNTTLINNKFARDLQALADEIEIIINENKKLNQNIFDFNYLPLANASGPYTGFVNQVISFNGINSISNASKITKYEWDLDMDGEFDDSFDPNPLVTYDHQVSGFIGLKVTNQDEWSDITYSRIDIMETNRAPIITNFSPHVNPEVTIENTLSFNISAFDPDHDDLSIEWVLDNQTLLHGSDSFNYSPSFNDIGNHIITAKVSDLHPINGTFQQTWLVQVNGDDNDGDKWNSNIDCNDNNPNINPGTQEIHYNSIDDDCNSSTLDNNTPPNIQNVTFETIQNQRTTIELSANDIDNDIITFSIVDGPVNGTLGNIVVSKETNYVGRTTYSPDHNFHGIDSFTFLANDGNENSTLGQVNINVGPVESPIAQSQDIEINEDSAIKIQLKAISPDSHPLKFSILSFDLTKNQGKTNFGILKDLVQTGPFSAEVTYIPIADYNSEIHNSQDSFVFEVSDGISVPGFEGREKSSATVSINIKNVNDPPNTINHNVFTKSNTPVVIDLKGTDVENDVIVRDRFNHGLQFSVVDPPSHGTLSGITQQIQVDRSPPLLDSTRDLVTYTPSNNFVGKDSFTFVVSDGQSSGSLGNITITVQDPNTVIQRTEFEEGDIVIGTSLSGFQWYDSEGNHIKDLASNLGSWSGTGGAFDSQGNLYVTHFNPFGLTGVSKYDKNGSFIERWNDRNDFGCLPPGTPHTGFECMSPESIVIDKQDNIFVGGVARAEGDDEGGEFLTGDHRDDIRKFNSDGLLLNSFDVKVEDRGSDWMELDPNQCTMYYTSEDKDILRYDVCDGEQLSNFANTYGVGRILDTSHKINYALRLLPTGEFLVASNTEIWKLDSQGSLIQKYDAPGENTWFALNINPDGKTFWSASLDSPTIYKFDIETGKILNYFTTHLDGITGITIKGEPTLSTGEFAPIVFNQTGIISENVPTLVNLTGFDVANDPLTFTIVGGANSGTLSPVIRISDNVSQVTYTPNTDFDGTDSFAFNANDGKLNSTNTGKITITKNHAPIANDDEGITTSQGIPINISVLDNDTDIDIGHPIINDKIRITNIDTLKTLGNVTLNSSDNTTINYVPFAPEYIGPDSFNYTIIDKYGLTDTAQVSINILSSNNIPVANNHTADTLENTPKTIQLIATDADAADGVFYQIIDGPANGFISDFNSTTGIAEYHPLRAFHGEDSFTFRVHDGKDKSLPAFVNITVIDDNINDPPVVESERVSANVSQQISVNVLQNDIDPNGDLLTLTNFTGPFNGTAILNQDQTITYQSDPNFNNSDVLYYRVSDTAGDFDIGQLIIDVQGNADTQFIQVHSDRLVTTTINQSVDIGLAATATIDRPVSFFIVDAPENGTLGDITTLSNLTSSIRYTPNSNFQGTDSFTYVAKDANGVTSNLGTIQIAVNNISNNPPIAQDVQVTLDEDKSTQIQLDVFDIDLTDSLTYSIETQPFSGNILNFDPLTGSLVYQPNSNFNGNDSFLFKAVDQHGAESNMATVRLTVNPVNDPPLANNQQVETNQNIPIQITLAGTDPVDSGDTISHFRIVNNPINGQITGFNQNTGALTYTPNNNFFGTDSFTFKVIDNNGAESTDAATVSIKVNQIVLPNIAPLALDKSVETFKNTAFGIQLQGIDFDQGDTIDSFRIVDNPTNGQISNFNSGTGTLTYNPNTNYVGSDSFTFKVTDNHALESTNTGLVTINVKATEEPPNNEQPPLPLPSSACTSDSDNSKNKPKGTQGNDELIGTSQRDTIAGLGGNDRFNGCSGDDTLNGNSGNDGIAGGPDDDNLHGNEGNDYLQGDSGSDSLYGNEGNDIFIGNEGRDIFFCGSGNDQILDFDYPLDVKSNDCEEF